MFRRYGWFAAVLLLLVGHQIVQGATDNNVYICVAPDGQDPYYVQFGQSTRFGFIVPENATATLYSPSATAFNAALYSVVPDVKNGTYLITNKVSQAETEEAQINHNTDTSHYPCDNFFSIYPDNTTWQISPPIAPPVGTSGLGKLYMLIVNLNTTGESESPCPEASSSSEVSCPMGIFSIHIRPEISQQVQYEQDFQIAQFEKGEIDIRFPFLGDPKATRKVRIVVIGTKSFDIERQFPTKASWITKTSADGRLDFIDSLGVEPFAANQPDVLLDLTNLMEAGNVRVYPAAGLVYDYPNGGFIRLKLDEKGSARDEGETAFEADKCVSPLDGIEVPYYPEPDFGKPDKRGGLLRSINADVAKIDETRDNGLLIITQKNGKYAIGSWLMKTVTCSP